MKIQRLVSSTSFNDWQETVNKYLGSGWTVVPTTVIVTPTFDSLGIAITNCVCVIEKEKE
jgi:hypothetical protein